MSERLNYRPSQMLESSREAEIWEPLSGKYHHFINSYPQFAYILTALQKFTANLLARGEVQLSGEDEKSLILYAVWVENPEVSRNVAASIGVNKDEARILIDRARDKLSDATEEFLTIIERTLEKDEMPSDVEEEYTTIMGELSRLPEVELQAFRQRFPNQPDKLNRKRRSEAIERRTEEILRLREQQRTEKQIADALGISIRTVEATMSRLIKDEKVVSRRPDAAMRPETVQLESDIIRLANQGLTIRGIADSLGCTYSTVRMRIYLMRLGGRRVVIPRGTRPRSGILEQDLPYFKIVVDRLVKSGTSSRAIILIEIFKRCRGLYGSEREMNLAEIGRLVGVTGEYARQVYKNYLESGVLLPLVIVSRDQ